MSGEDEDITIDLRLRDYLTGGAATAAHEMEELADSTKKAARALLLLDKRADKAANSLYRLAAAAQAARGATVDMDKSMGNLNKSMSDNLQTQRSMQKSLGQTTKKQKDAEKNTRILHKTWRAFTRTLKLAGPLLAMVAKGLALIGAASLLGPAVQQILAVAGALTTLLSFSALVPIALGGIVAAAVTAKLAFGGLGAAIKAAASGDAKALEKAFSKLGPHAKEFVKELTPALRLYKGMKDFVQGQFLGVLNKDVPRAVRRMFPVIKSGMRGIAKEFGLLINNIAGYFNTSNGERLFGRFFQAGEKLVALIRRNIGPLLEGLGSLVEAAMPAWNRFLDALDGGFGDFANWMTRISQDGSLENWLDTAFEVAKNLWGVLSQLNDIIGGIIKAAGGASGGSGALGAFGVALGEVAKWVNSFEGQMALQNFFASVGEVARAVSPIIGTIAGIIGNTLAPALAAMVTALAPSVNVFFQALGQALQVIAPYLPPIAKAFGDLLVALTPLLPILAQLIAIGLQQLAGILPVIVPLIQIMAQAFSALLLPALQVITPLMQTLMPVIQLFFQVFTAALAPLIPQLQILGQMFAEMLQQHLGKLVEMLPTLIPLLMNLAYQLGTFLVTALTMLMPYMPQILQLMGQMMGISLQLAPVILQLATMFLMVLNAAAPLAGMFLKILGVGLTMMSGIMSIVSGIIGAMNSMASGVNGAVDRIIGFIQRLIGQAGRLAGPFISAAGAITGAISGIAGAISGAIGAVGNLISRARDLASIDINPFRFAGGPVDAGQKYTVGEIGPEMYVPKVGSPQMIGTGGMESRSFGSDGFIIPSFMLGAFKSLEQGLENVGARGDDALSARDMAAIAAAAGGGKEENNYYDVDVIVQGNIREEVDIERAVKRGIEKAERERRERK